MMVEPTGFRILIDNSVFSQWKKGDLMTLNKYGDGGQNKKIVNKAGNKETFYI
ncbi:MAG: hypothetical protein O4805_01255 [Trichodesmium sp. St16_bin2-tuft]|nr:hypothetical protein [Trichodesmium sp. St16_bin2-tuft]